MLNTLGTENPQLYKARMNGEPFEYYHELEKEYMSATYGTMIYQEQFMLRVNKLAGWTLGKGDSLRKVKNISQNTELKNEYLIGCGNNTNMTYEQTLESWKEICDALEGGYSFNKSHAASYADISYQTAWLKHYYPVEFMASLMTSESTEQDKIAERVNQCKLLGIKLLPPDINKSNETYQVEDGCIRFAMNTIKGIGENAIKEINRVTPVESFNDFIERSNARIIDKTVVTNLIKAGVFDWYNKQRYELLAEYYSTRKIKKDRELAEQYKEKQCGDLDIARMEKETLGLYLTKSPFEQYSFKSINMFPNQGQALIGGEISKIKQIFDKNNRPMAFITLTTQYENVECVVFSTQYAKFSELLQNDSFVMIGGRNDNGKILVDEIKGVTI